MNDPTQEFDAWLKGMKSKEFGVDEFQALLQLSIEMRKRLRYLETLFLEMYERGSADPQIEDQVEQMCAIIVDKQKNIDREIVFAPDIKSPEYREALKRLIEIAIDHCPIDHSDWNELIKMSEGTFKENVHV